MATKADRNRIAVNLWTARVIPIVLAGVVSYATYVLVALLCVNYLLVKHHDTSAAVPVLVTYFLLFILMTASFLRLVYVTAFDPPYVPLGRNAYRQMGRARSEETGIEGAAYDAGDGSGILPADLQDPQNDPDSPGLESFYTKDVFVCEGDGRPKWCHECANWKPDRTHHCSSSGRCIKKMDHFCPWVGGPIGENNFKFFVQFTGYTGLYCLQLLVVMAIYIQKQVTTIGEDYNRHFVAILALAAFFGLFTATMTITSLELAANNQTQVERLGAKTREHLLAVYKPNTGQPGYVNPIQSSWYRHITYPLGSRGAISHVPIGYSTVNSDSQMTRVDVGAVSQHPGSSHAPPAAPSTGISLASLGPATSDQPLTPPSTTMPSAGPSTLTSADTLASQSAGPSNLISADPPSLQSTGASSLPPCGPTRHGAGLAEEGIELRERFRLNGESLSPRDLNATRTFGVLKMLEFGSNPWDLGSAFLNLETVMGTSIIDWLLPIRRSPCCNHEDPESHFLVGPAVDITRASYNFIETREIRARGGRTPLERTAIPGFGDNSEHAIMVGMKKKFVKQIEKWRNLDFRRKQDFAAKPTGCHTTSNPPMATHHHILGKGESKAVEYIIPLIYGWYRNIFHPPVHQHLIFSAQILAVHVSDRALGVGIDMVLGAVML